MLIERQVSIFCAGISTAIVIPEFFPTFIKHVPVTDGPHVGLLIGTSLGALGVLTGMLIAVDEISYAEGWGWRSFCLIKIFLWIVFALGLSAGTAFFAFNTSDILWRILLGVVSLTPLIGLVIAGLGFRK
ncbi:MAG: hypothetical protein Q7U10_09430 [Thermodesulfovibrionia bacterium]|nr:hypothetical protein [Thermodesulfovibrionia bacterium]